jgi:hypothetical protein
MAGLGSNPDALPPGLVSARIPTPPVSGLSERLS